MQRGDHRTVAEIETRVGPRFARHSRSIDPGGRYDAEGVRKRGAGYTLVELVVVIALFAIVMTLISVSFNRIVASSGQIVKSSETDIGGLIGLELLRIDLGFAGFGLPWSLPSGVTYNEAKIDTKAALFNGYSSCSSPALYNDAPSMPPRAFVMADGRGSNGSDYLALKGTALGMTPTSRRWSYLSYSSTEAIIKKSKSEVELTLGKHERVIVISSGVRGGLPVRDLVTEDNTLNIAFDAPLRDAFKPKSKQDSYLVYGVAPQDPITFPFNRADYYLGPSDRSSSICSHGTGMLYRGLVSQNGNLKPFPILDCVADLQVVFRLDSNGDGVADVSTNDIKSYSAQEIREQVKEVRVYILAQQGKRDAGFSYPVMDPNKALVVGDRTWTQSDFVSKLGGDWQHYRWKVYTIVVQPKNLY